MRRQSRTRLCSAVLLLITQGKRIEEIKDLMERTRTERAQMFALYQGIKDLDELLRNEALGFSSSRYTRRSRKSCQEPWLNYVMSKKYTDESISIIASNRLIEQCRQRGFYPSVFFGAKEVILS
jgi:hypothetical protein